MLNDLEPLLLEVAKCDAALTALPENVRSRILKFKEAEKERILTEAKWIEEELKREEERERKRLEKAAKERDEFFCKGDWGEKIPLNRRFALCKRMGKRFVGWCGQENDPSKWEAEEQFCAIDLVRGYMSPYWGYYYTSSGKYLPFYKERIKPILEAQSNEEIVQHIRSDWNSFKLETQDDCFSVLSYSISGDSIILTGESPVKRLAKHQKDLKKEFCT